MERDWRFLRLASTAGLGASAGAGAEAAAGAGAGASLCCLFIVWVCECIQQDAHVVCG